MTGQSRARRAGRIAAAPYLMRAAAVAALFATTAYADTISTYTGPDTGTWNSAANWTNVPPEAFVPNNGNGGVDYQVIIDNSTRSAIVTTNGNFTVNGVTIDLGDTLTVVDNNTLTVLAGGTITDNGTFNLSTSGNPSRLMIGNSTNGTLTLAGTGFLVMSNSNANLIGADVAGKFLLNTAGHHIQGGGIIGTGAAFTLLNQGFITAANGGIMTVNPGAGLTNTGTMQAGNTTSIGTLVLQNDTYTNTGGSIIANDGSVVQLRNNSNIIGGLLTTNGTGSIQTTGGHFSARVAGVTLTGGSKLTVVDNSSLILTPGFTFTDNGLVLLQSAGNQTNLQLGGPGTVTLAGSGTVSLGAHPANRFLASSTGSTLVNVAGHTIEGGGTFSPDGGVFAVINSGLITSIGNMSFRPGGGVTNTGTLTAGRGTLTGTLQLENETFTNAGGSIIANDGSVVQLRNNSNIIGGLLTTNGTGSIQTTGGHFSARVAGVTLTGGSKLTVVDNSSLILTPGFTFTDNGLVLLQSAGNQTNLQLGGPGTVTLAGSGTVSLGAQPANRFLASSTGSTLVNVAGHTIEGGGTFSPDGGVFAVINSGLITSIGNMSFRPGGGVTNTGTLTAGRGTLTGTLQLENETFTNAGGSIIANDGSVVQLRNNSNIIGGLLITNGTGSIQTTSGHFSARVAGVTLTGGSKLTVVDNSSLILTAGSTLTNEGTIALVSAGNQTNIVLDGPGAISLVGSGTVTMNGFASNRFIANGTGVTFIHGASHTIIGAGVMGPGGDAFALVNNGTIAAFSTNGAALTLATGLGITNNGLLLAAAGTQSILILSSAIDNTSGVIRADAGGRVVLNNSTDITGGTLQSVGSGEIQTASGSFSSQLTGPLLIPTGSLIHIVDNSLLQLNGGSTYTNNGLINFTSIGNQTRLRLTGSGTVALAGTGVITLNNFAANRIDANATGLTLINTTSIEGSGAMDTSGGAAYSLVNAGTISGVGSVGLIVAPGAGTTNNGLMQAGTSVSTGILDIRDLITNNGTILANAASTVIVRNGTNIVGGTLSGAGTGSHFTTIGGQFTAQLTGPMTITSGTLFDINDNSSLHLVAGGVYTNHGVFSLNSIGNQTNLVLDGPGTVTLAGSGTVTSGTNASNRINAGTAGIILLNASGHTIMGSPVIGNGFGTTYILVNEGIVRASNANTFIVNPGISTANTGTFHATNGSTLQVNGLFLQDTSGTLTAGTYISDNNSRINLINSPNITTIGALATVILNGSASAFNQIDNPTNTTGFVTTNSGTFRLLDNRSYTVATGFTNNGTLELGGGTFTAPNFTNNALATLLGFGTVAPRPINHGTIRAVGGTLVFNNGIQGGSGTIQIDPGATLDLSPGALDSSADNLIHNGSTPNSLVLGGNDVLVKVSYTNNNFGSGNSFNKHANVSPAVGGVSGGRILADGNNTQSLSGSLTGGTLPSALMDFGHIHVGDVRNFSYTINNNGSTGPSVLYAIQTSVNGGNITDGRLTGTGVTPQNIGPVALGASSSTLGVTLTGSSAGTLTGQAVHIANNFDNIAEQTMTVAGAVYRYAAPVVQGTPLNLGKFHVGDAVPPAGHYALTNNVPNDGFSEKLDASVSGASGPIVISGSVSLLLPGATNNTSIVASLVSTATAGHMTGTANLNLVSNGEAPGAVNNSGLGTTPLPPAVVLNASADIYRYANPVVNNNPVNFGNRHLNDVVTANISVTNNVPNDTFSEDLKGVIGSPSGANTFTAGTGNTFDHVIPTGSTNVVAHLDTSSVGTKSGSASLTLISNGDGNSGLGQTPRSTVTLSSSGAVYRLASAGTIPNINLGQIHVNATPASAQITITNTAPNDGFSEKLAANFVGTTGFAGTSGGPVLVDSGTFNGSDMAITLNTSSAQIGRSGTATVHFVSDGAGTSGLGLTQLPPDQVVSITADVLNFASASMQKNSGNGAFTLGANSATLDFGNVASGSSVSALLSALNVAAGPADTLGGSWTLPSGDFNLSGFTNFSGVVAGGSQPGLGVGFSSTVSGLHSSTILLDPVSTNNNGSTPLTQFSLTVQANVLAEVPEPASAALLLAAAPLLLRRRRRC